MNPIVLQGITGSPGITINSSNSYSASYYANGGMLGITSAFAYCQHSHNPHADICHRCKHRLVKLSGGNCYYYEALPKVGKFEARE